jgi:hypothetical protein
MTTIERAQAAIQEAEATFYETGTDSDWNALEKARAVLRRAQDEETARQRRDAKEAAARAAKERALHEEEFARLKEEIEPAVTPEELHAFVAASIEMKKSGDDWKARSERNEKRLNRLRVLAGQLGTDFRDVQRLNYTERNQQLRHLRVAIFDVLNGRKNTGYVEEAQALGVRGDTAHPHEHYRALAADLVSPSGMVSKLTHTFKDKPALDDFMRGTGILSAKA